MLVRFTVRGQGVLKKNLLKPRSSSKFTDIKLFFMYGAIALLSGLIIREILKRFLTT